MVKIFDAIGFVFYALWYYLFHRHHWTVENTIITQEGKVYTLTNPLRYCKMCDTRQYNLQGKWYSHQ